ncbi:hypothetical protein CBL_05853 [Carabus blaptoides fortunei]
MKKLPQRLYFYSTALGALLPSDAELYVSSAREAGPQRHRGSGPVSAAALSKDSRSRWWLVGGTGVMSRRKQARPIKHLEEEGVAPAADRGPLPGHFGPAFAVSTLRLPVIQNLILLIQFAHTTAAVCLIKVQ